MDEGQWRVALLCSLQPLPEGQCEHMLAADTECQNPCRSALGLCRLPEKLRYLCILGEWCLFAVPAPLLASAPSVFRAVRVIPALVCGAEHRASGHTTASGANTRFVSIAVNSAVKRGAWWGMCPGSFRSYFGFIVPVI